MGVKIKVMHPSLILITILINHVLGLVKFTIPKTDVVHPKSGLILHYTSEYRPANKILTFSVSLPMYSDMCFLIPNEAMGKIPECEDQEATLRVIRETQQELQQNNNTQVQPAGIQEDTLGTSVNGSQTTKRTKKSKKTANPTTKLTSTVNPTTRPTLTINPTTRPILTINPTTRPILTINPTTPSPSTVGRTTKSTQAAGASADEWRKMKEILNQNNGTFHIVKQNGTLTVNFTAARPDVSSLKTKVRRKRILPVIIGIGVGITSTALSAVNLIQAGNLKAEIKGVKDTLGAIHLATINNEAQILHLNEGQLKLAKELADTQVALNKTMALVNQHAEILHNHAEALKTILSQTLFLRNQLDTVTHALNTHFIHESMENIMLNKLNLHFVHHKDMSRVVKMVTQTMNLTADEYKSSIPMVEIITRLLVRQQIDFVPLTVRAASDDGILIGKMVFTSYFAAPAHGQDSFSIYEVVPIPFNQGKRRVQLARMPAYLGIEPKSQQFIRWTKDEAMSCDLEVMPSCRETPIKRRELEDECIYQILTDIKLKNCRVESFPDNVFIRRVGQHWAISTLNSSKCHAIPNEQVDEHMLIDNEEISIPEIAVITVSEEKSLACDRFIIPKAPTNIDLPINLIYNETISPSYKALINLQEILDNETHWEKLPYITSDMQAAIDFISNTPKPTKIPAFQVWTEHPISFTMMLIVGTLILVIVVLVIFMCRKKKLGGIDNQIVIAMPSMKELLAKEEGRDAVGEKY